MDCRACGFGNPDGFKFCGSCASPLSPPGGCPQCGFQNPPGFKFCGQCAGALEAAATRPGAPASFERSPRDYTPKHLAERILKSRSAVEGERKHVTVLFADVKGSMELAEQLDAEAWHRVLERFFEILAEGVHRFEGTVNQYTGDGIMALFGAPIAHEDHAQRACYAALQIRSAVREYANEVRARHGVPFGVRIGLNSGEVVVGKIGDDLRMDYTAQGHTVGLAQRMESLTESGHIGLSEYTAKLVEGFFRLQDLGPTKVKGVEEPIGMFELEEVGAFRTRLDRSRARGLSTFVGRDRDMAALEAALERAQNGNGQVVGIMADAGTGKSRLCAEFVEGCRARGIPILEGRGVAHGKSIPMLPMLEVWRAFYGITDDDSAEVARAKIAGRLLLMGDTYRELLPIIFDVFGVPDPANPAPAIDPEQRQRQLHGVVKRILHDPGYGGTRVFLLEDLHWFDGASDGFLSTLIESTPATRNLVVVNFRPEYKAPWMQRSHYQQIPLQPLGAEAIRALLRDQLGDDTSVRALPEAIHERTKGNPFFIEEVVQSLVEGGQLVGERGAYRLTTPVDTLEVPASVQSLLAARIDRLPEREKQVLQTAAAVGKTFPEALLRRVVASTSQYGETMLGEALSALCTAEFLFEAALYPQLEYSFKHPLTQDVAQKSQLRERRAKIHAAVASALEEVGGDLDEQAAEIAHHWAEAGDPGRAARWYQRAAHWAGFSDPREVLHHWRRVRELAPGITDTRERDELLLQACVQLFALGWRMGGSSAEAEEVFAEGRALAEQRGDLHSLAILVGFYGLMRNQLSGSASDYVRYGEEAAAIAESTGDPVLLAGIGTLPAFGHFYVGTGEAVLRWTARVLELTGFDNAFGQAIAGYSPRASMYVCRNVGLMFLGRLEEAGDRSREMLRVAEESQETEVLGWGLYSIAWLAYTRGGTGSVLDIARRSIEIGEKLDIESSRAIGFGALGFAHRLEGEPIASRDALLSSIAIVRERRTQLAWLPLWLTVLADVYLALGETDEALRAVREAIALSRESGAVWIEAFAQIGLSAVLLATQGIAARAEIERALARAEELVEAVDGRSLSPRILEARGRLAAASGDSPAAERLLRAALDFDRRIGATGHAARLEREIGA